MTVKYLTQLEPDILVDSFLHYPPQDFQAWLTVDDIPAFSATFDLLTTADNDFRNKIKRLPFYHRWQKLLTPTTCFIGTTVSEYVLLKGDIEADKLATQIKIQQGKMYPLTIVKDIPQNSPLHSEESNLYSQQLIQALKIQGFIEVEGQALAWVPVDYHSIDDYLSRLSYSRRKNFRRKLKARSLLDIEVIYSGDTCFYDAKILAKYYQLYLNVYQQSEIHFDCLTAEFFASLLQNKMSNGVIITYRHQDKLIGYNLCFIVGDNLVDKYIGFEYPAAREFNLYYISWFYNLEFALNQGLKRYIAGWTDPEVKASLGAQFTLTKHLVYFRNPILRILLKPLVGYFEHDSQVLGTGSTKSTANEVVLK